MRKFSFSNANDLDEALKNMKVHHGGEGSVYNDNNNLAIKIFNAKEVNVKRKARKVYKLSKQAKKTSYSGIIMPIEPVTINKHFVGYTMKYVENAIDLDKLAEKIFLGQQDLEKSINIMIKVAQTVEEIHKMDLIIGDFHPGQILVSNEKIFFVDTDSWGWEGESSDLGPDLKCLPFYVDPRCRDFSREDVLIKKYTKYSDYYSLAVIAFYVLTGEHPFGGVYQVDKKMSKEMRARNQLSVLGEHDIKIMKGKTWEVWMTDELKNAFLDIFERGKRYNIKDALNNQLANLKYCKNHKGYFNKSYKRCPLCSIISPKNKSLVIRNNYFENVFLSSFKVKQLYDYRTYLNNAGEVVRINEKGEVLKKNPKGTGKRDTIFFDNERCMVKIKPLNFFQKFFKSGNTENACYMYLYYEEVEKEKFYVSDRTTIRIEGNNLFYIEDTTHTLKKVKILNGQVVKNDVARKQTSFEYVATADSHYAIISKNKSGIEIDIDGNCTVIRNQVPLIMKYDEVSNMWIFVSKLSKVNYNTIVFQAGNKIFETTDINYDNTNLTGSAFHRATLCLASNGKMISVMPYVKNMPFTKVITETMVDIISKDSSLYIKSINEKDSELYVLNKDNNVYKFMM